MLRQLQSDKHGGSATDVDSQSEPSILDNFDLNTALD